MSRALAMSGGYARSRVLRVLSSLIADDTWQAQREVHTGIDRYPEEFAAAACFAASMRRPETARPLRVLSFGCSTGEECFSLHSYFPDAAIFGCDINKEVLTCAVRRQRSRGVTFFHSSSQALRIHGPFDIIFCMSSLCLFPAANRPSGECGAFPFAAFDDLLSEIDHNLAPGGLLVLYNASYPFRMARIAPGYECVSADVVVENGFVNKLHRNGKAFTVSELRNHFRCHRMVSAPQGYLDSDFIETLFRKRAAQNGAAEPGGAQPGALALTLSPRLPAGSELLCSYTLADDDNFSATPQLLTATWGVELFRDPSGVLFEQIVYRRRSVNHDGFAPGGRFVLSRLGGRTFSV